MVPIVFNGKFYAGELNGVHRVADRLIVEADRILATIPADRRPVVRLLLPRRRDWTPQLSTIEIVEQRFGHSQFWEQITLPWRARGAVLVNLCNMAPLLARRRILLLHDAQFLFTDSGYPPRRRWGHRLLAAPMMRGSAVPLTVSHYSRQIIDLTRICPRERVGVLHNGVDHMHDIPANLAVLKRLKLEPRSYSVMFGSAKQYKNVAVVLRAFAMPGLRDVTLVIVGTDAETHKRAGIRAPANTVFAAPVSDPELKALYQNALCVLMPSRTEGFGLPPVEAMHLGCPAVVAPAGALPEVCVDAACYAGTDAPAEWVSAITALRDDPSFREAKIAAGRRRAAQLSWGRSGLALLNHALVLAGAGTVRNEMNGFGPQRMLEPEPGRQVVMV